MRSSLSKTWASDGARLNPSPPWDFSEELPEGKARSEGVEGIMENWAKKDPQAAGEWLNEKEAGP